MRLTGLFLDFCENVCLNCSCCFFKILIQYFHISPLLDFIFWLIFIFIRLLLLDWTCKSARQSGHFKESVSAEPQIGSLTSNVFFFITSALNSPSLQSDRNVSIKDKSFRAQFNINFNFLQTVLLFHSQLFFKRSQWGFWKLEQNIKVPVTCTFFKYKK